MPTATKRRPVVTQTATDDVADATAAHAAATEALAAATAARQAALDALRPAILAYDVEAALAIRHRLDEWQIRSLVLGVAVDRAQSAVNRARADALTAEYESFNGEVAAAQAKWEQACDSHGFESSDAQHAKIDLDVLAAKTMPLYVEASTLRNSLKSLDLKVGDAINEALLSSRATGVRSLLHAAR